MKLLIVESPGKVKKIQEYLGSGWKVSASVGHVRDLPIYEMGVSPPDFRPQYAPTDRGKSVLARLATEVKASDAVFLAMDPDREGEAIAWHLSDALRLNNARRVTFSEITEKAVQAALGQPRDVDRNLVAAQEGRRVLDRLVGYMVSGPLSRCVGGNKSAGRVQSPALRLVVEREREIRAFKVTTHYGVELVFDVLDNITQGWKAAWSVKAWLSPGHEYLLEKETAVRVAAVRRVKVLGCQDTETRAAPPAPFTTSTLQQAASNALKLSPKMTMAAAQKLYEAGHITYMRTDSPNISEEAVAEIREYCRSNNWPVVATPRRWKSKAGAQEAHEAIRPTHIDVEEEGDTDSEKALYAMIRQRTLASQLEDAVFAVRTVQLQGEEIEGRMPEFEAKGRTLIRPGWKVVMATDQSEEGEEEADNPVPQLKADSLLTVGAGKVTTHKTKPPVRYTEATLIKALEGRGIGRPSTYAAILENILGRGYVRLEKRALATTEDGEAVVDAMAGRFAFLEYSFTKELEDDLDAIAQGRVGYVEVMRKVHRCLEQELGQFQAATATPCPDCGKPLARIMRKPGKNGQGGYDFWGCSGYPNCHANFADAGGKPGHRLEKREKAPPSEFKCPDCEKPLVHRVKDGSGGFNFWGCSGFPKCKVTFQDDNGKPEGAN